MSGQAMCAIHGCGSQTLPSPMWQYRSRPWISSWIISAPSPGLPPLLSWPSPHPCLMTATEPQAPVAHAQPGMGQCLGFSTYQGSLTAPPEEAPQTLPASLTISQPWSSSAPVLQPESPFPSAYFLTHGD